jgi:hypothetical protein
MFTGKIEKVVGATERGTIVVASLLGSLMAGAPAAGQDVTVDVGDCVELEAAEARLACFAAQVDAVLEKRIAGQSAVDEPRRAEADEGEDEYFGTIVAIRERLPDAYIITLDNGQIWQQTAPKRYPLRPGLEVRIYPTNWGGSYRLNGLGIGGHIQVRRVE